MNFDHFISAQDIVRTTTTDRDHLLVYLLTDMADRIAKLELQVNEFGQWRANAQNTGDRLDQLETRLDRLSDQTVGNPEGGTFVDQVLNVLDVCSGSARVALNFDANVLRVIEDNSGEAYAHIEAEIEEKIDGMLESHAFSEAVNEAVQGSLHGIVEEVLDGLLHDAIVDAVGDAEDIVRKGLRSIL